MSSCKRRALRPHNWMIFTSNLSVLKAPNQPPMNAIFDTSFYPYARHADQDESAPRRHPVVIIGAGPVGLALAVDLAQSGIKTVMIDDNDKVSFGSRAVCFAKRTLEIADRLGFGQTLINKGVQWNLGKVFLDDRKVYEFNLLAEDGHRRPAFINLQQYYFEITLVGRARALQAEGAPVDLRASSKVTAVTPQSNHVTLQVETPEGPCTLEAEWLIAFDGAASPVRKAIDLDFVGHVFEGNFLIADVVMDAMFPVERWFWFDPPFNRGQSSLLRKQPDNV